MNSFQRKTLASYGVASETDSLCQLFPSVLFPEAGTTEEKAHVACVLSSREYIAWSTEDLLLSAFNSLFELRLSLKGSILLLRGSKTPQSVQLSSDP